MKSVNGKFVRLLLCLVLLLPVLTGCAQDGEADPTIPRWKFLRKKAEILTVAAKKDDFALLEDCINLQYLDLTGSTCYDEILEYIKNHPNVEVVYTAPLGSLTLSNTETQAALEPGTYDIDSLLNQLKYLPAVTSLELPKTTLLSDDITRLQAEYPLLSIRYTVALLGQEVMPEETTLDLSSATSGDLTEIKDKMTQLPALTDVTLSQSLTMGEVKELMELFPDITFQYTFDLFGKTLSTAQERVEYLDVSIGNSGEAQIRAALDIMPRCTYFKLENCGLDNEVLAAIQTDYPDTKIVWRVSFGGQYSLLTDETTLRTVYGVENSHNDILKYCTSLKYIDMGHNTTLTDISFASYMPDLEILILSGSSVQNVDALANCKNLVFLEMANCYALEDISGLENCENLRFLNIGFSKVTDLTPIQDLPLERFIYLGPKVDQETQKAFEESHPDCWVRFTGNNPLSLGWKYDDVGITYSEYYKFIREVFQLDDVDRRLAQQAAQEEAEREEEKDHKEEATPAPAPQPEPEPEPESEPAANPEAGEEE